MIRTSNKNKSARSLHFLVLNRLARNVLLDRTAEPPLLKLLRSLFSARGDGPGPCFREGRSLTG